MKNKQDDQIICVVATENLSDLQPPCVIAFDGVLENGDWVVGKDPNLNPSAQNAPPFTIFSSVQRTLILVTTSLVSFIGPLTANIYLPILHTLAGELQVSDSAINLSITIYLVFQGVTPIFVAPVSDVIGRRPTYAFGLALYTAASFGLAAQRSFSVLMALRCIQSIGSAAVTSLGSAVVADCIRTEERGSYLGYTLIGAILGPSLSPVLGGILSQLANWTYVFLLLGGYSGLLMVIVLIAIPETCRNVVGNGSLRPPSWYYQPRFIIPKSTHKHKQNLTAHDRRQLTFGVLLGMWPVLCDMQTLLIVLYASYVSAGYWCISATLSTEYARIYGLENDLLISLCYLPIAAGSLLVAVLNGKWDPIDRNYHRHLNKHLDTAVVAAAAGVDTKHEKLSPDPAIPIEKARLQVASVLLLLSCVFIIVYGWTLQAGEHARTSSLRVLAAPLLLLFFVGFCMMGMGKVIQILLMDLHPSQPATAGAAFTVARCVLGAGATAVSMPLINALGNGWAYTAVGSSWLILYPSMYWMQRYGSTLRGRTVGEVLSLKNTANIIQRGK